MARTDFEALFLGPQAENRDKFFETLRRVIAEALA